MGTPLIAIIMGSKSDFPIIKKATDMLDELKIPYSFNIFSAHRTPTELADFVSGIDKSDNYQVIIAGAGMSAALAGCIASKTIKPVIGIPLSGSKLNGMDALLSTAQMPPGLPVACTGIDASKNAALLAAEILALSNHDIANRLRLFRAEQRTSVINSNNETFDASFSYKCNNN